MKKLIGLAAVAALAACNQNAADNAQDAIGGEEAAATAAPKFAKLGQGFSIPFPGHDSKIIVGPEDLPSEMTLMEIEVPPRSVAAPPHRHVDEDEIFIVTDGGVTFLNGEEEVPGPEGTVASLPRGHWHGFWNENDEPARLLLLIAPGRFSDMFDAIVLRLREEGISDPENVGRVIAEEAGKRNVEVDPSRFPASAQALMGPPPSE